MSRFLVFGASGMAGHVISLYLKEQGHDVTGFTRRPIYFLDSNIVGDAFDEKLVEDVVANGYYDFVINAIGLLVEAAENRRDLAAYLNGYFPHRLAYLTSMLNTRVIQMSTDCVFAGNTGPYVESSFPDGRLFYDRSKALGELDDNKNLTMRNSIIGPDMNYGGTGLFNWFMKQTGSIDGFSRALWTGLTTLELAKAMEYTSEFISTGLVNMVPSRSISKYNLLCLFSDFFENQNIEIRKNDSFVLDKTLVRTNYECGFRPKMYRTQIEEMAKWIEAHRELYPHYNLG